MNICTGKTAEFPHPLMETPRPGRREIRLRPRRDMPFIRNEKEKEYGE